MYKFIYMNIVLFTEHLYLALAEYWGRTDEENVVSLRSTYIGNVKEISVEFNGNGSL